MSSSPFVVGIDLGTTNTALAFARWSSQAEKSEDRVGIETFAIPQVLQPGRFDAKPLLPSYVYLPQPGEVPSGSLQTAWDNTRPYAVGEAAKAQASLTPSRVVSSAKSWLCHAGIDRRAANLPWKGDEQARRVSPLEASALFLQHLREAWDLTHKSPNEQLGKQEVVLTVPASFDAVARALTVEAAQAGGLENVSLLEEPQAAFYAWLDVHHEDWRDLVAVGDVILVCDVGGGTTDFTLIAVTDSGGKLELHRLAVGDHILLGGDNMDLALAHFAQQKIAAGGAKLDSMQMQALAHACRAAKEQLLGDVSVSSVPVAVLGRGRSVIGGSLKTELTRAEVNQIILDGFFPNVPIGSEPRRAQQTGLQELGLPYAADPTITKHLAAFLRRQEQPLREHFTKAGAAVRTLPNALLCNGGVFKAADLRHRLLEVLTAWSEGAGGGPVKLLEGNDLDQAVARGAAYYGLVQRGKGIRIRGGTARTYYIGVETAMPAVPGVEPPIKAVCVAPFGMEEDSEARLEGHEFGLVVGQESRFRFLSSAHRRNDPVGTVVEDWSEGEIEELAPLTVELPVAGAAAGSTVPVRLRSKVTPIGTLELWCSSRDGAQEWKLEFNVREQK